jgi:DNA replication and repair protein RecF
LLVRTLWLTDFRSYDSAEVSFSEGLTAILGPNGHGKTNLIEALGYLATLGSMRGAPTEALIRAGAERAVVRAEGTREGRDLLLEAEIVGGGRNRIFLNRQKLPRARDLLGALRVTVFSPDDLALVKGGPAERRRYLDDLLVSLHPRYDALQGDVERILRQRNALLKQCAGGSRFDESAAFTLDVWDEKLADAGTRLGEARRDLVARLQPELTAAFVAVASGRGGPEPVAVSYDAAWSDDGLAAALAGARTEEVRRGVTLVGPHRDDLVVRLDGLPARTHASQGEQRTLALALRLAGHAVVTAETGTPPVLLLDDVFSELDPDRSDALLVHLPPGQAILTSAAGLPPRAAPDAVVRIESSKVLP